MDTPKPFPTSAQLPLPVLRSRALWIVVCYAGFATLWILFSDNLVALLIDDPRQWVRWSVYKGLTFVAITSSLLLLLMRRAFGALAAGYAFLEAQQAEISRLSRLYSALGHISQAIVRIPSREALAQRICEVLASDGGFELAWVGWHQAGTNQIANLAAAGEQNDFLRNLQVYSDDRPEGRGPTGTAFKTGQPYVCNDLMNDPATLPWRVELSRSSFRSSAAFPVREDGAVVGVLSVYSKAAGFFQDREVELLTEAAMDISFALDNLNREEKRLRAEERAQNERIFSKTMIESMPGVVYLYDAQGKFLRWNRNFEIVSGYSGEEIARMRPTDFFSPAEKQLIEERSKEAFDKGEASVEALFLHRDGRAIQYFFTGRRVFFEKETCLVGVGTDISERKRAELALRVLNQTLEMEVMSRTAELKSALTRAESADRIKSAFLATMSHELRTPLNSIIGFTGILLQGLAGPLNAEQTKQLGMVRSSGRHLLALINDVLDISKIEAGQLELRKEPFDLKAMVEHSVNSLRPFADKKGIALIVHLAGELNEMNSDRRRVEQILLNLLNNALKFTTKGEVTLTVELMQDASSSLDGIVVPMVRMRVTDTGIGIRPEEISELFRPFRQLDTGLSRQHDGTGLGLAICHRLAGLLGGTISARSEWQRGSEFTVVLPLGAQSNS